MFEVVLKLEIALELKLVSLYSSFIFNKNSSRLSCSVYLSISRILRLTYRSREISSLYKIVLE